MLNFLTFVFTAHTHKKNSLLSRVGRFFVLEVDGPVSHAAGGRYRGEGGGEGCDENAQRYLE